MKPEIRKTRCLWPFVATAGLLLALLTQPAMADKYWVGPNLNNYWNNGNNWSNTPGGAPGAGQPGVTENAYLTQNDAINRTVLYNSPSNPQLSMVFVDATGTGTITLKQPSNALSTNIEIIGWEGTGNFTQSGGTNTIKWFMEIGGAPSGRGAYYLMGGVLQQNYVEIGMQGTGSFIQTGGNHTVGANTEGNLLLLGEASTGSGTYDLKGGRLWAQKEHIGVQGIGSFTQTGGSHTVNHDLIIGVFSSSNGTYQLQGGDLKVGADEVIGQSGTGSFTQTGGNHKVTNKLTLANNSGSSGTYNLRGGTLSAKDIFINYSGGFFNVDRTITTVTGNVVNDNVVKTSKANVTWNGLFTNKYAYKSDVSTQTFTKDLVVGPYGYLVGHSQDLFIIKNDFKNQSTNNLQWDTVQANLQFAMGADNAHLLYIPGADLGKNPTGYTNNFAWGTLNIAGQRVTVLDGNNAPGGALYVGGILGATVYTGLAAGSLVTNIFGPNDWALNLYYDPDSPLNNYLVDPFTHKGRTYSYASGKGALMPYHTPVPASVLLLGSGLFGLGVVGWRRRRRS